MVSDASASAFQAAAGFSIAQSANYLMGTVISVAFLWAAWTCISAYRGWQAGNISSGILGGALARLGFTLTCLIYFMFS